MCTVFLLLSFIPGMAWSLCALSVVLSGLPSVELIILKTQKWLEKSHAFLVVKYK